MKRPVVGMGQYRDEYGQIRSWENELIGLWSDDTSLTLCLVESLLNGFDLKDQAEKFVAWLDEGYLSARDRAFVDGCAVKGYLTKGDVELYIKKFQLINQ